MLLKTFFHEGVHRLHHVAKGLWHRTPMEGLRMCTQRLCQVFTAQAGKQPRVQVKATNPDKVIIHLA